MIDKYFAAKLSVARINVKVSREGGAGDKTDQGALKFF
jgi:hypothetical protein